MITHTVPRSDCQVGKTSVYWFVFVLGAGIMAPWNSWVLAYRYFDLVRCPALHHCGVRKTTAASCHPILGMRAGCARHLATADASGREWWRRARQVFNCRGGAVCAKDPYHWVQFHFTAFFYVAAALSTLLMLTRCGRRVSVSGSGVGLVACSLSALPRARVGGR